MKKVDILKLVTLSIIFGMFAGCSTTHTPPADPNMSDMTKEQSAQLSQKKFHVPCRVEVHCPDSLASDSDAVFDHYYQYPLQEILTNGFKSAIYCSFDQPGSEIVDAFTVYVTVPESRLLYTGGAAEYYLQVIVRFNEPGEKKITAFTLEKSFQGPVVNKDAIPNVVYEGARALAFMSIERLTKDPKVLKTVKRFEDK